LLIFDWAVDDDYVFVRKTGKGAIPAFATGKSAEALKKKVQELLEKQLDTPAPSPKKYF
jgi:hypothetical protein